MEIITISGVDGSGKTTQTSLLKEALVTKGYKTYYFHATLFSIANRDKNALPGSKKAVTQASFFSIQLRKIALLIDLLRFEILLKKLHKKGYTHIISDRYFYDTVINILYLSRHKKYTAWGASFIADLIPTPSHAFYLEITPETISARDREIEQGADYLREKITLWHAHTPPWQIHHIDAERSVDIIQKDLLMQVTRT